MYESVHSNARFFHICHDSLFSVSVQGWLMGLGQKKRREKEKELGIEEHRLSSVWQLEPHGPLISPWNLS